MANSNVVVIGAGPSGLATAACLTQLSIPYTLIEREDCIAPIWNKKSYDRLHLHLPKQYCELPLIKFPPTYSKYVPKRDFTKYLDNYVAHFNINPLYKRCVNNASFDDDAELWRVRVNNGMKDGVEEEYLGRFLVVATGNTSDPFCPKLQGLSSFKGKVIHSTEYKCGKEYEGKKVLVVGAGNSGMEIALDLANYGAITSIVVRSPVHIMSRSMMEVGLSLLSYLPLDIVDTLMVMVSQLAFRNVANYGLTRPEQGPFTFKKTSGKFPIVDVGTYHKISKGDIKVFPAITSIKGNKVFFEDGKCHSFDAIIFATGFKQFTNKWLQGDTYLLDEDGKPKPSPPNHWKGENGLYCAGLANRGFFGAAMDAHNIANDIKSLI